METLSFCKLLVPTFRAYNNEIILYQIDVQVTGTLQWRVEKRYSDLYDFSSILKADFQGLPKFPGKTMNSLKNIEQIEKRRIKLNKYMEMLSKRLDIVTCQIFVYFFEFEKYASKYIFPIPQCNNTYEIQLTVKAMQLVENYLFVVTSQTEGFKQLIALVQNTNNEITSPLGTLELFDITTNEKKWSKQLALQAQCLFYSDSTLLVGLEKGFIYVYQIDNKFNEPSNQIEFQTHKARVNGVYFDCANQIIYSIGQEGLLNATYRDYLKIKDQITLKDELTTLLACEQRNILFIGNNRGSVYLFDINDKTLKLIVRTVLAQKQKVVDFALNSKQGLLYIACEQGSLQILDIGKGGFEKNAKFKAYIQTNEQTKKLCLNEGENHLYIGDSNGHITLYSAVNGNPIYQLKAYEFEYAISALICIKNADIIFCGGKSQFLKQWKFNVNWLNLNDLKNQEYQEIRNEQLKKPKIDDDEEDDGLHCWHKQKQ